MTDHEAKAEISEPVMNVFEALDLPHHAKALEVWTDIADQIDYEFTSNQVRACVSSIVTALREAEAGEREACAKIVDNAASALDGEYIDPNPEYNTAKARQEYACELVRICAAAIRSRNDE